MYVAGNLQDRLKVLSGCGSTLLTKQYSRGRTFEDLPAPPIHGKI